MAWWHRWCRWLADPRRAEQRRAQKLMRSIFDEQTLIKGTSLRREHRSRAMYLRHETDELGAITRVTFGIVRHPRPYPFSRQFHEVLELWTLDVSKRCVTRDRGVNLSRAKGTDGEPAALGPGI